MKKTNIRFAERLKELREAAGVSMTELARAIEVSKDVTRVQSSLFFRSIHFLYIADTKKRRLISVFSHWCGGRDLNSYGVTHRLLRPARLPISPPPRDLIHSTIPAAVCQARCGGFLYFSYAPGLRFFAYIFIIYCGVPCDA